METISNATHGISHVPKGMVLNLYPDDTGSTASATSSHSGDGPWSITTATTIGPWSYPVDITVQCLTGRCGVEISAPATAGSGTVTSITVTQPASGLTVTGSGVAATATGSFTVGLANDLAAVEGLLTTGLVRRTATDTWSAGTAVNLATEVTGVLPVLNGGTGTTTPGIVAGTNVTVSGTWPNQTVNSTASGTGDMLLGTAQAVTAAKTFSDATVLLAGSTSGTTTVHAPAIAGTGSVTLFAGTDTVVGKATTDTLTNKTLVAPVLGTPASGTLTSCTGLPLTTGVTGLLPVANGGTGTASPGIVAGTNVTVTGTWPNQTVNSSASGTGTVTATAGSLTSNNLVLGAGTTDTKAVAGITSDGTSKITLGVAGTSVGAVAFGNATSGTVTLSPVTGALGAVTLSLPAATDTLVGRATTDTLTNKTLTSPTLTTPVLGTPSSGTLTSCTGLPVSTGISGLATGAATFLATATSANLAALLTDETGTGANVFATSPTLVTPLLGTPTSGNLANCTGYPADATKASVTQTLFTKSFFVPAPVDGQIAYVAVEEGMTITKITAKTSSGTATLTAAINGTNLTGTAVSAASTKSSQTYSAANVATAGQDFTITASASSSPVNLGVTVVYTKTLA